MSELTLIDRAFLLKKTALFRGLDLDTLLIIADKAGISDLRAGEPVFQLGMEGAHLYVVVHGSVAILDPNDEVLCTLGPSHFFGDESVFSESVRPYGAKCESPVRLLSIVRSHLLAIIYECPSVALQLLREYARVLSPERRYTEGGTP